ncbi:hypothetical protein H4R27_003805 [Coemansia aciculifera]|nr:hypothetical protein H4R27_003805 [Coemansia aciculifera]
MNNTHQLPVLSEAQEFEVALRLTARMMADKDRNIAELERTIAERDATIAEQRRTMTGQENATAEHERSRTTLNQVNVEQRRTIAEREQTITEREVTIAELRHLLDEQKRTNAELEHANINQRSTIVDQRRMLIELGCTLSTGAQLATTFVAQGDDVPLRAAAPRVASPDEDAPPRAAAPRDDAPPRGAPTGNDAAHTVTGSNTTARSGAGSSSTARTTATHSVAAPADEIGESAQLAKRRRVNHQVRDGSDQDITSEHLLVLAHPFTLIDIDVLADIFKLVTRRRLIPEDVESGRFARELARLEGLTRWPPRLTKNDLPELATLNLLRCGDMDSEAPRQTPLQRLGLAEGQGAVVLGPVLCYALVALCGIRLEQMSGPVLEKIFKRWTGKSLSELTVATRYRVGQMSETDVSNLVRDWVQGLCTYITRDGGVKRSLTSATQCNRYYMSQCPMDANGARSDPTGNIAKEVLDGSSDCRLFLGLSEDIYDLEALCKRFFATADGSVEQHTAACLRQIADS